MLNIILVFSFAFVSVALGIRWISQSWIDYKLAKLGLIIERLDKAEYEKMMGDKSDE